MRICAQHWKSLKSLVLLNSSNQLSQYSRKLSTLNISLGSHMESDLVNNLKVVSQHIEASSLKPNTVQLVAVSKTKPASMIKELYDVGHRHFGENYFQELEEKASQLPTDIQWHFIGHLQSSKASKLLKAVPNLAVVESVDSMKLASKLNSACETNNRTSLDVYIQVHTSDEETKSGLTPDELIPAVLEIRSNCPRLSIRGLMTIGAPGDYAAFDLLSSCRAQVAQALSVDENSLELSMGMSSDYEIAISKGATVVRVGSTIFGPRLYKK